LEVEALFAMSFTVYERTKMILHLRGRVEHGRREDLVDFLAEAIPVYERPGGIAVRLLANVDDPDAFVEVIEYADADAFESDQVRIDSDPEMRSYLKRWRALLAEPVVVEKYRNVTIAHPSSS
jgi:quinol monooxygenase YgiN